MRIPFVDQAAGLARTTTSAVTDAAGRAALAGLDALLQWEVTDEAVKRVLASPVADRAVGHALRGPLVDAIARDIARYAVFERIADEQAVDAALQSAIAERVATQLIESR